MLKPEVKVREIDGVMVADFWDSLRLDPQPIQDLRGLFEARLSKGGAPDVVIDLSGVSFAGSMALAGFLKLHRLVCQKGGRMVFCHVEADVFEVFRVSRVDHFFRFVDDIPAACRLIQTLKTETNGNGRAPRGDGLADPDDPSFGTGRTTDDGTKNSPAGSGPAPRNGSGGGSSPISRVRGRLR